MFSPAVNNDCRGSLLSVALGHRIIKDIVNVGPNAVLVDTGDYSAVAAHGLPHCDWICLAALVTAGRVRRAIGAKNERSIAVWVNENDGAGACEMIEIRAICVLVRIAR
jgi:hypothetical protein